MKSKYIFGGFIIVVFFSLMGYLFTETNIGYEEDFSNVINSEKTVRATGFWVKEKSYNVDNQKKLFSFYMKDYNDTEIKVVYKGAIPNNFESATSVVVTGKYQNGVFVAKDILTKCPSKYEEEFEGSAT
ncbi:MAG: cytochrome c maturation protein CcmE [Melioribacteraceae bacterium]|nr:cytochrome c maturation protein CcmE [Melioribacteraceae bacterium]MCF8263117.1 cytochrome c maturation protein CcmE [Melioribacteraceae bacterium]MCF8413834.1 cytochrome c maturation protein CcmE [Melioribacteraceae bacterium]MCF8430551.1 cytochrome c maturation protein CcmE [Melioribacteraceae bacterium]